MTLLFFFLALGYTISLVGQMIIFIAFAIRGNAASINTTIHVWLVAALWTAFLWSVL